MSAFSWAKAVRQGPSHEAMSIPCQDALSVRACAGRDGRPWIVAALADGAGSASHSEHGSQYITECFTSFVCEALSEFEIETEADLEDLVSRGVMLVRDALFKVADSNARAINDYATTLLVCVSNAERCAFAQIGDGAIVIGAVGARKVVFRPQHGAFVNETAFLTNATAQDDIQVLVLDAAPDSIVMFSDGLEDLLVSPKDFAVHPPLFAFLDAAFADREADSVVEELSDRLAQMLASNAVTSRSDDDTSILAIHLEDQP